MGGALSPPTIGHSAEEEVVATITFNTDAPTYQGAPAGGRTSPVRFMTGSFDFDSSYPTGGEDISTIFDLFNDVNGHSGLLGVTFVLTGAPVTIDTKVITSTRVDYTNKLLLLYGEDTTSGIPAQVSNGVNASTVTGLRWIAWGTR